MGKLDGKIALITGGSSGIGFATAQQFLAEGAAHVYITGRGQDALDNAIKQLKKKNVTAIQADASKLEDLDKIYDQIKKEKKHLDILFANAGVLEHAKIDSITEKHFDYIFDTNCKGVLFTVQKALPIFSDGGSIILNGSVVSQQGKAAGSVYCATKAALRSFARCWTVDLKERKIRVNVVSPGATETPGLLNALGDTKEKQTGVAAFLAAAAPLNRLGTPDEIAKAVVFLASDDSSYVTGIELFVDGGAGQI
jgi:NAD(P)-dependent dehydrogenase (short-subunit alcohol dehydrogenase family)